MKKLTVTLLTLTTACATPFIPGDHSKVHKSSDWCTMSGDPETGFATCEDNVVYCAISKSGQTCFPKTQPAPSPSASPSPEAKKP